MLILNCIMVVLGCVVLIWCGVIIGKECGSFTAFVVYLLDHLNKRLQDLAHPYICQKCGRIHDKEYKCNK